MITTVCHDCNRVKARVHRGNVPEYVARLPCVPKDCHYRPRQLDMLEDHQRQHLAEMRRKV